MEQINITEQFRSALEQHALDGHRANLESKHMTITWQPLESICQNVKTGTVMYYDLLDGKGVREYVVPPRYFGRGVYIDSSGKRCWRRYKRKQK